MQPERTNEEWDSLVKQKILEVTSSSLYISNFTTTSLSSEDLASVIDHTLLKPDATPAQIDELCDQAIRYKFRSCCVNGANIKQVARRLLVSESVTVPCCVVGFPLGASTTESKAFEAAQAIRDGAKEIDTVLNIGALKARHYAFVSKDIRAVIDASGGNVVKVILETFLLTEEEKIAASFISAEVGASFVKTCTGFSGGAASAADISLTRKTVAYKGDVKVKASAGIRTFEKCLELLQAGADRIGTSSGVAIMQKGASAVDTC